MPNLHVHFHNGNVKLFKQELEGTAKNTGHAHAGGAGGGIGPGSASGGKSWSMSGLGGGLPIKADPNERDQLGRTVLHLAASSPSPHAYTFLTILLRHPQISVNLQDQESGYTALHRALFVGNIKAARELLARHDIDSSIKDSEGMTAYDLYNGTVDGTNPPQDAVEGTDLFVWGVNRNFALGTGDSSDKTYPDHINLLTQNQANGRADPSQKFNHIGVKNVVMAKLHTGVITSESQGNLSICGFGANGRLGRSIHSQLSLLPMPDMPHNIIAIALGQDHTLAVASGGYVLSWGHDRFSQLGYVIEQPEKNSNLGNWKDGDELVQISPKRIIGPLKKEWIKGVAAGRMASACWSADAVWTWGTNAGHLGYDKAANPVQVVPRRVTSITQPVIDIALSDYAMICLLDTNEVLCFHRDTRFKISFSTPRVLSDAYPFRPPQSTLKPSIVKVTSCGAGFAALSSIGDVFTFTLPNPLDDMSKDGRDRHVTVKPQMIWALRKSFTAVKDVALGSDGTVIICTHSGHVFVRQRPKSGSGQLKFRRIPYLQRVIKVAANESGAFAAIRKDARPTKINLSGKTLEEDMSLLQPHFRRFEHQMTAEDFDREQNKHKSEDDEEDESSNSVAKDTSVALRLCAILSRWRTTEGDSLFAWSDHLLGSDIYVVVQELAIPVHTVILRLRVPRLAALLDGKSKIANLSIGKYAGSKAIEIEACHPMVVLLLLQYIYSDDIATIWDARVVRAIQTKFPSLQLPIGHIKSDLASLADQLSLSPLSSVLSYAAKQPITTRTLRHDLQAFFNCTHVDTASQQQQHGCDVTLVLADKQVTCSSVVLRARCQFFEAMFADSDWTLGRREDGRIVISMEHLRWQAMKLVFRYIHEGVEDDLFDYLHQDTLDDFLDFVFEVLAAATELLLDRLVLVCSRVIIRHCNVFNAAALAAEASFYQATTLKLSVFDYIIACTETMLESGLLTEMDADVLQELCAVITQKQGKKLSVSRSQTLVKSAMERQKEWLSLQDIPVPRVRQPFRWKPRSPALSPVETMTPVRERERAKALPSSSPLQSPELQPDRSGADDMFQMDDDFPTPPSSSSGVQTPKMMRPMTPLDLSAAPSSLGKGGAVWRSKKVESEKVDLRSIMAEAAASKTPTRPAATPTSALSGSRPSPSPLPTPAQTPTKPPSLARSPPSSGTPWRPLEARKTSLSSVQAQQGGSSTNALPSTASIGRATGSLSSPIPQRTGSGRVITPQKFQPPPLGTQRKPSGGAAWATPTTYAPPPPPPINSAPLSISPPVSSATQSFSLLAIQQQERDLAEMSVRKPAKSLVQIQEEEREAEKAKAEEQEFMRWWAEEEARVAKEQGSSGGGKKGGGGGGGGRGGKARAVNPRPRGGGKGGKTNVNGVVGQDPIAGDGGKSKAPKSTATKSSGQPPSQIQIQAQAHSQAQPPPAQGKAKPKGGGAKANGNTPHQASATVPPINGDTAARSDHPPADQQPKAGLQPAAKPFVPSLQPGARPFVPSGSGVPGGSGF